MDSLYPNAFNAADGPGAHLTSRYALYMVSFKSFVSAQNYIEQQQFSVLYHYQRKFFQTMSVKDIYKQMFEYVKENMPFDRMTILALDKPERNRTGTRRPCGLLGRHRCRAVREQEVYAFGQGPFVLALMRNRPVFRSFTSGYADYVPRLNDSEKRNMELRQLFVMPVASEPDAKTAELAICLESRSRTAIPITKRNCSRRLPVLRVLPMPGPASSKRTRTSQRATALPGLSTIALCTKTSAPKRSAPTARSTISACS